MSLERLIAPKGLEMSFPPTGLGLPTGLDHSTRSTDMKVNIEISATAGSGKAKPKKKLPT